MNMITAKEARIESYRAKQEARDRMLAKIIEASPDLFPAIERAIRAMIQEATALCTVEVDLESHLKAAVEAGAGDLNSVLHAVVLQLTNLGYDVIQTLSAPTVVFVSWKK